MEYTTQNTAKSKCLSAARRLHSHLVFARRARVIASILAEQVPRNASILDIGCGNGMISSLIVSLRPDVKADGIETLVRPDCLIPVTAFDGRRIPLPDSSRDVCMLVDVLHHADDSGSLLREASRASRRHLLVKDHLCHTRCDRVVLSFMDWVGNRPHGVELRYNYRSEPEWRELFASCGLKVVSWRTSIPLYPVPFSLIFGRKLHFIALLEKY